MNSVLHLRSKHGSVLVAVLGLVTILAMVSASVLEMISMEYKASKRSLAWNQAAFTAESGIEYGWNEMNKLTGINTSDTFMASSGGWSHTPGTTIWTTGNYSLQPLAGQDAPSVVSSISVNTNSPSGQTTITSVGTTSSALSDNTTSRTITAILKPNTPFNMAMLAKGLIDFNGSTAVLDSFNSANGAWSAATRLARGDVGTNGLLIDAAGLTVYGSMQTGPGGTVTESPQFAQKQGTDTALADDNTRVNTVSDGLKVSIPDAKLPSGLSDLASSGAINNNTTVTAAAGATTQVKYDSVALAGNKQFIIDGASAAGTARGTIQIYVTGNVGIGGTSSIVVTNSMGGTPPKVQFYIGGPSASLLGNGIVNPSATAGDMLIYGMPTLTSVQVGGTANFTGAIYAPSAAATINGSPTYTGAIVANTVAIPGGPQFHYDEALANTGMTTGYSLVSYREQ